MRTYRSPSAPAFVSVQLSRRLRGCGSAAAGVSAPTVRPRSQGLMTARWPTVSCSTSQREQGAASHARHTTRWAWKWLATRMPPAPELDNVTSPTSRTPQADRCPGPNSPHKARRRNRAARLMAAQLSVAAQGMVAPAGRWRAAACCPAVGALQASIFRSPWPIASPRGPAVLCSVLPGASGGGFVGVAALAGVTCSRVCKF